MADSRGKRKRDSEFGINTSLKRKRRTAQNPSLARQACIRIIPKKTSQFAHGFSPLRHLFPWQHLFSFGGIPCSVRSSRAAPSWLRRPWARRRGVLYRPRLVCRGTGPHAALDRRPVLSRPLAARHRQRPDHRQQFDHAGRRRNHPPDRPGARRRRRRRSTTPSWRSGNRRNGVYLHTQTDSAAAPRSRISRASAGSPPAARANTASAPSSRSPIRAARRTFTSRSSRATASC